MPHPNFHRLLVQSPSVKCYILPQHITVRPDETYYPLLYNLTRKVKITSSPEVQGDFLLHHTLCELSYIARGFIAFGGITA